MALHNREVPSGRRRDAFGIHSIGEFVLVVPALQDAERFYGAFGLDVAPEGDQLALRTRSNPHRWGRVIEGPRKHLHHISFHCYEEDLERFGAHLRSQRVPLVPAPRGFEGDGLWFHDPDGLLLQVRSGVKTSPDAKSSMAAPLDTEGVRCAPYRRMAEAPAPRRLSHILRFSPDVSRAIGFYCRVLGLGLSDRSGDGIAFLHAIHGSDHHIMAFAKSPAPGLHHFSWVMPSVDSVGLGAMAMADKGYSKGWGVGRHVLGSNYFHYCRDPWGSYCEYSCGIDFIPADANWEPLDHPAEESLSLWGPEVPGEFIVNHEAAPG